ncbi:hypothetical protein VTJ83DRAFT_6171 [Remersonia thermophila]|uniref:EVE domain-containing protein n=1 Tax=Remersonia thermophila TaxID=72144 RepID=A0ABR4DB25_9PEZI
MAKRKSEVLGEVSEAPRRRSARLQDSQAQSPGSAVAKQGTKGTTSSTIRKQSSDPEPTAKKSHPCKQSTAAKKSAANGLNGIEANKKGPDEATTPAPDVNASLGEERNYWLMKAEPESRFENGVDVKFSIDDLAAKTEPEPWDGIRAYAARNNLRAMKKGDLAFFYHSNCKEPGIVGTMEIVQEHSPDLSAHDPKAPYYDPTSSPSNPKWSVVHVEFRSKFAVPIGLKELREMGGPGKPLENMQMLKQSRLSVSKVAAAEWEYLMSVAKSKAAQ